VTAEATDTGGQTTQDTLPIEITNPALSIHVSDLDGRSQALDGRRWRASVTVRIHDADHAPVPGVAVMGSWDVGAGQQVSCLTNARGRCRLGSRPHQEAYDGDVHGGRCCACGLPIFARQEL
jgi:hypothetical protein